MEPEFERYLEVSGNGTTDATGQMRYVVHINALTANTNYSFTVS